MCVFPQTIVRAYNKENGQTTDNVPCGTCYECLLRRAQQWAFRLEQEQKHAISSAFITLTYALPPVSKNGYMNLNPKHVTDFMKRLRHYASKEMETERYITRSGKTAKRFKHPIKYYLCGEYGSQYKRPHYHAIMFNIPNHYLKGNGILNQIWTHGNVDIGTVTGGSMLYTTGYIQKGKITDLDRVDKATGEIKDDRIPEFSRMSKGLGAKWLTPEIVRYYQAHQLGAIKVGNSFKSMPRYYKERLFTKQERIQQAKEFEQHNKSIIQLLEAGKKPTSLRIQKQKHHEYKEKLKRTMF